MVDRVRYGILGTASIARRRFVPAVRKSEKSEVVAIASRELASADEFAAKLNIPRPYSGYEALLEDPAVEVVYIPLPNHLHAQWTIRAADAGKHVLCEKPMAVDAEEAQRMADHCRRRGVLLMEGFMYRLNPRTLMIGQMLRDGAIGEVRAVVAQFAFSIDSSSNTRLIPGKGAGSLMDVGCYCINFSRYAFGADPVAVHAHQRIDGVTGADMTTSAILEFDGGQTALVNCSFETAFRSSVEVAGSEGILRADRFFTPPQEGKIGFSIDSGRGDVQHFEVDAVDQFLVETDHFSDCVRGRAQLALDPHEDAAPNAKVIDAIRESAGSGCRVEVRR